MKALGNGLIGKICPYFDHGHMPNLHNFLFIYVTISYLQFGKFSFELNCSLPYDVCKYARNLFTSSQGPKSKQLFDLPQFAMEMVKI